MGVQPVLNRMMHRVREAPGFLTDVLKGTVKVDDFTRRLVEIYESVARENRTPVGWKASKSFDVHPHGTLF